MSHDRGCSCGKEPYEYDECRDKSCSRSPVYDPTLNCRKFNGCPDSTVCRINKDCYGTGKPQAKPKKGWLKEELARTEEDQRIEAVFDELRRFYGRPSVQAKIHQIIKEEQRTDALKLAADLRMKADAIERAHK